ncbi:MAG: radical SAM protein [Desulfovibrionaceae bacterium]|nr:radical SAM protein [Desulfovibrionaceae bacterium]
MQRAGRILPVFLPFAACPGRCVFCAQDRQTGLGRRPRHNVGQALSRAAAALEELAACPPPGGVELAFYGGTFTGLPTAMLEAALELLARGHGLGVVSHGRCSTRPDTLGAGPGGSILDRLKNGGLDLVELGVQSFDDHALHKARRGYRGQDAEDGCRAVTAAGLALGIQLLPGMPGVTPAIFLADVDRALALRPACLRFYPCVVPDGTELASLWKSGRYKPWSLPETVRALGEGLRRAWAAGVPVIRLAVAPEAAFDATLLAGPRHPALGALIQAEALLQSTRTQLTRLGRAPRGISLPRRHQGCMYGQRGALREAWAALGLPPDRVRFHTQPEDEGFLW